VTARPASNLTEDNSNWRSRLLLAAYLLFIALLLGADNTKLTNNVFYLFLMLPAGVMIARRQLRPTRACLLLGATCCTWR